MLPNLKTRRTAHGVEVFPYLESFVERDRLTLPIPSNAYLPTGEHVTNRKCERCAPASLCGSTMQ